MNGKWITEFPDDTLARLKQDVERNGIKPTARMMHKGNTSFREGLIYLYGMEWFKSVAALSRNRGGMTVTIRAKKARALRRASRPPDPCRYYLIRKSCRVYMWANCPAIRKKKECPILKARNNMRTAKRMRDKYNSNPQFRLWSIAKVQAHKRARPDLNRLNGHHRRVLMRGRPRDSNKILAAHLSRSIDKCYWCGKRLAMATWTIDHVVPISKGGTHTCGNIVKACAMCNGSKSGKSLSEWCMKGGQQVML